MFASEGVSVSSVCWLDDRFTVCEDSEWYRLLELDVFELDLSAWWWQSVDGRGEATLLAVQFVVSERLWIFEVTEAGLAEVFWISVFCDIEKQALEVLDPSVVAVPVEQIHCDWKLLLADVVGTAISTVVRESVEIDVDLDEVFD